MALLIPIFALFGWIIYRSTQAAPPCALCEAVEAGDIVRMTQLLDGGAVVTDRAWRAALERVESTDDHDGPPLQMVMRLLDSGADPNYAWVSYTQSGGAAVGEVRTGRSETLGSRTTETDGRRCFASAAVAGDTDDVTTIEAFLTKGLDVQGQPGGEALIAAARAGHVQTIRRLLQSGVPVNYVASEAPRRTALAEAIQLRHLELIAALESAGAREW